jgi:hypothetical protein
VHLGKRAFKVLDQLGEAPLYRARTGNQNIIISLDRGPWPCEPHRLFEPPPRPVARDSTAEALGRGEAEASNMVIGALIRNTAARLQDKRGCHVARSALHMKKLGTGLETSDGRHRLGTAGLQADRRLRPLALRRASTLRPPLVAMRARNPWRRLRTSRDGW